MQACEEDGLRACLLLCSTAVFSLVGGLGLSITRREFLQQGGMAAAAIMLPQRSHRSSPPMARPVLDPNSLAQFVDPLPIPEHEDNEMMRPYEVVAAT
jgi:hypothetical protein